MPKHRVLALVPLAAALLFPAAASAHNANATITCDAVRTTYDTFWASDILGGSNTIHYRVTVDGNSVYDGTYVLNEAAGSAGSQTLALSISDGATHTVAFYAAWGPANGTTTVLDDSGGSMDSPRSSQTLMCPPPPPEQPPPPPPGVAPPPVAPPVAGASAPTVAGQGVTGQSTPTARCAATFVRHYRVRAGQLNTIRVRVRDGDGKPRVRAVVRARAPGVHQSRRTNSKGVAVLRVRPKQSGRMTVTSPECASPSRLRVLAKKRSASRRAPRFTG